MFLLGRLSGCILSTALILCGSFLRLTPRLMFWVVGCFIVFVSKRLLSSNSDECCSLAGYGSLEQNDALRMSVPSAKGGRSVQMLAGVAALAAFALVAITALALQVRFLCFECVLASLVSALGVFEKASSVAGLATCALVVKNALHVQYSFLFVGWCVWILFVRTERLTEQDTLCVGEKESSVQLRVFVPFAFKAIAPLKVQARVTRPLQLRYSTSTNPHASGSTSPFLASQNSESLSCLFV